jgi:hypothetical protein
MKNKLIGEGVDAHGRVVLDAETLALVEGQFESEPYAGGAPNVNRGCDNSSNIYCQNDLSCTSSSNTVCTNRGACLSDQDGPID